MPGESNTPIHHPRTKKGRGRACAVGSRLSSPTISWRVSLVRASALGASWPTGHVDHIGWLGAGTAITDAQPPLAACLDHVAKIDHAGILVPQRFPLASSWPTRCRPGFLHHQPPFPGDVAGQRPPGHVAGFKVMPLGGEHVSTLKAKTGPWSGQVDTFVRVHLGIAACCNLVLVGCPRGEARADPELDPAPAGADEPRHTAIRHFA